MWVSLLPAGQQDIVFSGLLCFQISCLYHHYLHPTLRWRSLFLLQRLCLYELFLLLITISLCIHLRCTLSTSLHLLFKYFLCYWQTLLCCQLPSSLPSQCCTAATASVELPYQSRLHKSGEADVAHLPYSNIFLFKYMLGISFILMPMCMCVFVGRHSFGFRHVNCGIPPVDLQSIRHFICSLDVDARLFSACWLNLAATQ